MVTLHHAIKVKADRRKTYRAFTDTKEIAAWHIGKVEGTVSPGAVLRLSPHDQLQFGWRTESVTPDNAIVQTCIEGPGQSVGKTLAIMLADAPDGHTLVKLEDGGWTENDPHLGFCNTYWGNALTKLRAHLERTGAAA